MSLCLAAVVGILNFMFLRNIMFLNHGIVNFQHSSFENEPAQISGCESEKTKEDLLTLRVLLGCNETRGWGSCIDAVGNLLHPSSSTGHADLNRLPRKTPTDAQASAQTDLAPTEAPAIFPKKPPTQSSPSEPFVPRKIFTSNPTCKLSKEITFTPTELSYHSGDPLLEMPGMERSSLEVALCYMDNDNTQRYWIGHFPHASQTILPCWSFFQRAMEQNPNVTFGFWINNDQTGTPRIKFRGTWVQSLLPQTETCLYERNIPLGDFNQNHSIGYLKDANAVVYRLPNSVKAKWRSPEWFSRPEDARSLQTAVLGRPTSWVLDKEDPFKLQIGLIQRKKSRRVTNMDAIQSAIHERYPTATIAQVTMEDMNFYQQAKWWSQQHIVVSAHGAAMTNTIHLSSQAGIVEIFPNYFYELQYFKRLSESVGISHHRQWINASVADPEADYQLQVRDRKVRNVTPPVSEILQHVQDIVNSMVSNGQS